ncbi:flagellar motor protein MotB [uncultured Thalassospira sp.]|jgi:chemotaxis protein MotB|uniref:OmpA/MotB family protein n=1 Tax=uncultured Thalassospira sp. TaxID=404382 RepID=UPI0030D8B56A|tara:strand:- start:6228 stop:6923 length:696 start_codon:yes stop_codon:yes gene_type:complete
MARRRRSPLDTKRPAEINEDWLATYADAITLLMAFFVMLVSFSKIELPIFEKIQAGIAENIGKRSVVRPTEILETDLKDVVFNLQLDKSVSVKTDDEGILMELASGSFFQPGSADLTRDAVLFLKDVGDLLKQPRYMGFQIEVKGHTDDSPINTPRFPSNWELAAGRAIAVVRFFGAVGVDPQSDRMRAISYGDTMPKLPNEDDQGNPIPENREVNRRIEVRVFPKYARGL